MSSKLYFKITNKDECHNGFQYKDGLNILQGEFNDNPEESCVSGRLYFSNQENICKFLDYGIYLREVYLPINDPNFKMIKNPVGDKYAANMITLGKRHDLGDLETWKYMISVGVNIHVNDDYALVWACYNGFLKIVKFLIKNGANIHADNDAPLKWAARGGYLNVVKFLVKNGANINVKNNCPLSWASEYGHLEIVKYLIECGANIHLDNNAALQFASRNGHYKIVKYLIKKGANILAEDYNSLNLAAHNGHMEIIKYLIKKEKILKLIKIKQYNLL
uniref:Putative ankyrin repeat protein n=1 Tax=Moumouvirus sp. 'Monve' TaxID=1128131 RepID=H2EFL3_9VIRU|nr:putative ankyrin repeat protein [Moumouvirus Monve]